MPSPSRVSRVVVGANRFPLRDIQEAELKRWAGGGKWDRDWLVVIGSEERGLRRLTLEHCDVVCRLAPRGEIASLNASVAAAVALAVLNPS